MEDGVFGQIYSTFNFRFIVFTIAFALVDVGNALG